MDTLARCAAQVIGIKSQTATEVTRWSDSAQPERGCGDDGGCRRDGFPVDILAKADGARQGNRPAVPSCSKEAACLQTDLACAVFRPTTRLP